MHKIVYLCVKECKLLVLVGSSAYFYKFVLIGAQISKNSCKLRYLGVSMRKTVEIVNINGCCCSCELRLATISFLFKFL